MLKGGVLEYGGDRFILSPGVIQIGIHSYKARSGFLKMLKLASWVLMEEFMSFLKFQAADFAVGLVRPFLK